MNIIIYSGTDNLIMLWSPIWPMFITLVWKDQQSFYFHHFHRIILPVYLCACVCQIHCYAVELEYNHVLIMRSLTDGSAEGNQ